MQTEFYDTFIPEGQTYAYPTLKLYSSFKVDQEFQDYFSKWWRRWARYVHEIEERIISGSNQHYFDYRGFYYTNIQDTFVDYEVEDDPEWELHVRDPEVNLLPEYYYYVWSLWDSLDGLGVGTYSNSHWLTSEVDGFTGGAADYDHLLRQTFSFTIYPGSGGGSGTLCSNSNYNEQTQTTKYEDLPLSIYPSKPMITIKCPIFNFEIEIRQITVDKFKIISAINLDSDSSINAFNALCIKKLNEKISENPTKKTTALLSFKKPVSIDIFQQMASDYKWNIRSLKLEYNSNNGIAYIHIPLTNNKLSAEIFDLFEIDYNKISGVCGCEIEATLMSFHEYFDYYSYNTKVLNLVSLFADDWLVQNGYSPEVYTHIGFLGA
ncbi:MAG: hypothetical protein KAU62_04430 [Candidatus Heimdallarchaeota archaeon]|nr:hypothetical protein [Candidatus Heimdallarchaeota archaeon]MCG3255312.1 hypothetical protein [Candidatus Heimdallarchaeota archaeon]MCK4610385.1 hypothetical protein [Candidatus Heimdallarchaeota archaeon]